VVAQRSLSVHDSKVVVIAVAEVRLGDDLVDIFSALHCPDHAPTWLESEPLHLPFFDKLQSVLESVTELLHEFGSLGFSKLAGSYDVLAYGLDCSQFLVVCL